MTVYQKIVEHENLMGEELSYYEAEKLLSQWGVNPENLDWDSDIF